MHNSNTMVPKNTAYSNLKQNLTNYLQESVFIIHRVKVKHAGCCFYAALFFLSPLFDFFSIFQQLPASTIIFQSLLSFLTLLQAPHVSFFVWCVCCVFVWTWLSIHHLLINLPVLWWSTCCVRTSAPQHLSTSAHISPWSPQSFLQSLHPSLLSLCLIISQTKNHLTNENSTQAPPDSLNITQWSRLSPQQG